jgi:hypothetical protein
MIAFISFFDNEILMKKVEAEDKVVAVKKYLTEQYGYDFSDNSDISLDEIQQMCFDCDSMVGVQEI